MLLRNLATALLEHGRIETTLAKAKEVQPYTEKLITLAREGWKFLAMSTMSWPDGRQAFVTLWNSQLGDFARCFDYFDAAMNQSGSKCERSGTGL